MKNIISVALCTYNGEKFIEEQLDSILNQTVKVDEIVICDDNSTDKTIEIIKQYIIKFPAIIQLYRNEINLRSVKNFEKAISICSGTIIFLSDQDDVWSIHKVNAYVNYFNQNPNIKVIASNGNYIDEQSKIHEKYSLWDLPEFLKEQNTVIDYFKTITYFANIATGASMAFKKEIVSQILPFPEVNNLHHDEWIATIGSFQSAFVLLNQKHFSYRIHSNQQVGGVFFDKTDKEKKNFIEVFNLNNENISFHNFKIKLKRIADSYKKNKVLATINHPCSIIFKDTILGIEAYYLSTINEMKKQYFIKSFFVLLWDKIAKKRQLE